MRKKNSEGKKVAFPFIKKYASFLIGTFILAFGLFNIHSRCPISEGGVLGLSLLVHHWTGISPGISGFIMNTVAFLLGITVLGRGFLIDSIICAVSYSVWYELLELIGPVIPNLSNLPLVAAVIGGIFVGIGSGLVVRYDCAASGDDALALFFNKKFGIRVSRFYLISDFTILILSLSYIPLRQIAWSLLTVTISSAVIEVLRPKR